MSADDVTSKEVNEEEEGFNVHIDLEEPSFATKKKVQLLVLLWVESRDKEWRINTMWEEIEWLKDIVHVTKQIMEENAQDVSNEMKMIIDIDIDSLEF